jgi:hypothetical protein
MTTETIKSDLMDETINFKGDDNKKRKRDEKDGDLAEPDSAEPTAKRIKKEEASYRALFVLTHTQVDDDYKSNRIYDSDDVIGLYPSRQLALMYKYQKMVDIINETLNELDWWCIDKLPTFGLKRSKFKDKDTLQNVYEHFFVERWEGDDSKDDGESEEDGGGPSEESAVVAAKKQTATNTEEEEPGVWLELNLNAIRECLSSLPTAKTGANGWCDFKERNCHLGFNFTDLFDFLYQCEFRGDQSEHEFSIQQQDCSPTSTEWPELFSDVQTKA